MVPVQDGDFRLDSISVVSVLYATALVCIYLASAYTELATFPAYYNYTEMHGLFIYLFGLSIVFYVIIIVHSVKSVVGQESRVFESQKSHASFASRAGGVIFGSLSIVYVIVELIWNLDSGSDLSAVDSMENLACSNTVLAVNNFLMMAFILVQMTVISFFPRVALNINYARDRFGTMHVVATNIIVWMRTLAKETVHEMLEHEETLHKHIVSETTKLDWLPASSSDRPMSDAEISDMIVKSSTCQSLMSSLERLRAFEHACHKRHNYLSEDVISVFALLFPPVIEFSLIGASFAFLVWLPTSSSGVDKNMTTSCHADGQRMAAMKLPNARRFMSTCNMAKSCRGLLFGLVVLAICILNLVVFYIFGDDIQMIDIEYSLKVMTTVVSIAGIFAVVAGLSRLSAMSDIHKSATMATAQSMEPLPPSECHVLIHYKLSRALDMTLLFVTYFFVNLYLVITMVTGAFHVDSAFGLGIIAGLAELTQSAMQITYINALMQMMWDLVNQRSPRVTVADFAAHRPEMIFMFMLNIGQWLVTTFEVQKLRSSHVEASFYGFLPWLVVQRITLPLFVFFRFHSAVIFVEMWKASARPVE